MSIGGPQTLIQPRDITARESQHIARLHTTTYKHTYFTAHVNSHLEACDKNEHRTKSSPPRIEAHVKVHEKNKSPTVWQRIAYVCNTIWWYVIAQHGIGAGNETYYDRATHSLQSSPIRCNSDSDRRECDHIDKLEAAHNRLVRVASTIELVNGKYVLKNENCIECDRLIRIFDKYLSKRADEIAGSDSLLKREIMQAGVAELRSKFKIPVKSKRLEKAERLEMERELSDGAANEHLPKKDIAKASNTSMIYKLSQAAQKRADEERTKFVNSCLPDKLLGPKKLRILADFAEEYFAIVHQYNPEYDPKTTVTQKEKEDFVVQLRDAIVNKHELANDKEYPLRQIRLFTKKQEELAGLDSCEQRARTLKAKLVGECAQSQSNCDAVAEEIRTEHTLATQEIQKEQINLEQCRENDTSLSTGIIEATKALEPIVDDHLIAPTPLSSAEASRLNAFSDSVQLINPSRHAAIKFKRQEKVCLLAQEHAAKRAAQLKAKLRTAEADLRTKQDQLRNIDRILKKENDELQNQARLLNFFTDETLDRKRFLAAVYPPRPTTPSPLCTLFISGNGRYNNNPIDRIPIDRIAGFLTGDGGGLDCALNDVRRAQKPLTTLADRLSRVGPPKDPEIEEDMRLIGPVMDEMPSSYPGEQDSAEIVEDDIYRRTTTTNWAHDKNRIGQINKDYSASAPYEPEEIVTDRTTGIGVPKLWITTVTTISDYTSYNFEGANADSRFFEEEDTVAVRYTYPKTYASAGIIQNYKNTPESDFVQRTHKQPKAKDTSVDLQRKRTIVHFEPTSKRRPNSPFIVRKDSPFPSSVSQEEVQYLDTKHRPQNSPLTTPPQSPLLPLPFSSSSSFVSNHENDEVIRILPGPVSTSPHQLIDEEMEQPDLASKLPYPTSHSSSSSSSSTPPKLGFNFYRLESNGYDNPSDSTTLVSTIVARSPSPFTSFQSISAEDEAQEGKAAMLNSQPSAAVSVKKRSLLSWLFTKSAPVVPESVATMKPSSNVTTTAATMTSSSSGSSTTTSVSKTNRPLTVNTAVGLNNSGSFSPLSDPDSPLALSETASPKIFTEKDLTSDNWLVGDEDEFMEAMTEEELAMEKDLTNGT